MIVICAWCGDSLGERAPLDDPRATHSICPECFKRELATIPLSEPLSEPTPRATADSPETSDPPVATYR